MKCDTKHNNEFDFYNLIWDQCGITPEIRDGVEPGLNNIIIEHVTREEAEAIGKYAITQRQHMLYRILDSRRLEEEIND